MTLAAQQLAARVRAHRAVGLASRRHRVPRARPPKLIESDYAGRLVAILGRMRAAIERALPTLLLGLPRADGAEVFRVDDDRARAEAERIRAEAERTVSTPDVDAIARDVGRRTAAHHAGELQRQGRAALGVDIMLFDQGVPRTIEAFAHENAKLISKLKNRVLDDFEAIIARAYTNGTRAEAVAAEIAHRFDVSERHARLIARDQIARLTSLVTEQRHRELGIASFRWRSMNDPKVRREHRVLHGKVFRYDTPPAEGVPGRTRRPGCRCGQEPVFDELLALASAA